MSLKHKRVHVFLVGPTEDIMVTKGLTSRNDDPAKFVQVCCPIGTPRTNAKPEPNLYDEPLQYLKQTINLQFWHMV